MYKTLVVIASFPTLSASVDTINKYCLLRWNSGSGEDLGSRIQDFPIGGSEWDCYKGPRPQDTDFKVL